MADLRAMLYETIIRHEPNPHPKRELPLAVPTLPLATRLPQCVPPGLKFNKGFGAWTLNGDDGVDVTTNDVAELLFMGQAVKVLACDPRPMPRDIEEFAVALHKLADEMGV